jgi:hypothetical protein
MKRIHEETKKMARGDILAKIEKSQKSPTLSGHHGNFKPNIKNLFYQILVNISKILHVKNEEDPVGNKKIRCASRLRVNLPHIGKSKCIKFVLF